MGEIRAFRDRSPLSLSAFLSNFMRDAGAVLKQAGCSPATFETAYLIAAGWLLGLKSAAGTGLRQGQMHKYSLARDNTHTAHTFSILN